MTGSAILDAITALPPLLALLLVGVPVLAFVAWGPWAWTAGIVAGAWAANHWGPDAGIPAALVSGCAAYLLNCRWNPYADCWWCHGGPKRRDNRRHFHFCFFCGGNGRRTRLGAYAWPKFRDRT